MPVVAPSATEQRGHVETPRGHRARDRLWTLLALLTVLIVAEGAARWIEPRIPAAVMWGNPFIQAKTAQLEQRRAATACDQILVAGSSVASANVDTIALGRHLGTSAYNAALPSSNIALWDAYLRDLALTRARPNVVVFVVSPRDSDDNWPRYDSYLAEYRESRERRALAGDLRVLEVVERHAESVSAFMRIRSRIREPGRLFQHLTTGSTDGWHSLELNAGGRTVNFAGREFDDAERQSGLERLREDLANYHVGGRQFDALRQAIAAARERGATPLLVDAPAFERHLAAALPGGDADLDRYHRALASVAAQTDVPLLTIGDLPDPERRFVDFYHMNDRGAAVFTHAIGDWLATEVPPEALTTCT
jgi:hypothetical protein